MIDKHADIKRALLKITPGEWEWQSYTPDVDREDEDTIFAKDPNNPGRAQGVITLHPDFHRRDEDMEFIAAAPSYVSRLLDEVERLQMIIGYIEETGDIVGGLAYGKALEGNTE